MELPLNEIKKYKKLIDRRRYLFVFLSLSLMSVIVWGSYFIHDKYEAKSTVFIESNVIEDLIRGVAITPSMDDRLRVLKDTMLSRALILKVIQELGLPYENNSKLEDMIVSYQESTMVRVRGRDLFVVSIHHSDPQLAKEYVNTLVRTYVEENLAAKREEAYGASRFLTEQVALFKEKLDRAEDSITKFRQENRVYMSLDEESVIEDIKRYEMEIKNLRVRENELVAVRDSIVRQLKGEEPYTVVMSTKESEKSTEKMIEALEKRVNHLLVSYTENYPEVVKLRAEIEALKSQADVNSHEAPVTYADNRGDSEISAVNPIYQDLQQRRHAVETELNALHARQRFFMNMIAEKESELREIPEGKKKLAMLEKEKSSFKDIYEKLLFRLGQSEVSKQMEIGDKTTTFRIVDPAIIPLKPVGPDRVKLILAGIFFGFLGGFGGVFLRESIDTSVKDAETVKELGAKVLAVIPTIFNKEEHKRNKRKAGLLYSVAGFYFLVICLLLVHEMLGLNYVGNFLTDLGVVDLAHRVKDMIL